MILVSVKSNNGNLIFIPLKNSLRLIKKSKLFENAYLSLASIDLGELWNIDEDQCKMTLIIFFDK